MNNISKGNLILETEPSPEALNKLVSLLLRIYPKYTPEQLTSLVSRPKPLILVKGLGEANAGKFIKAFRAQGVLLRFEPTTQQTPHQPFMHQATAPASSSTPLSSAHDSSASTSTGIGPAKPLRQDSDPPGSLHLKVPHTYQPPAQKLSVGLIIRMTVLTLILAVLIVFLVTSRMDLLSIPDYEPVVLDKYGYPDKTLSRIEVRKLFEQKEFEKLNLLISDLQNAFEKDFHNEFLLHDAVISFHQPVVAYEEIFQEWVDAFPQLFQPYLARGNYYWCMGYSSRGTKWAKDTTDKQFAGMREYFNMAFADLDHALKIKPNLVTANYALLSMSNTIGMEEYEKEFFHRCESICPECYLPRRFYMMALQPKWGGSIGEMEEFARQSQQYADRNPLLKTLQGFSYMSKGEAARRQKHFIKAIKNYNKSLSYGCNDTLLTERAEFLRLYDQYPYALQDVDTAIALQDQPSFVWRTKALIEFGMTNFEDALQTIKHAKELAPGDSEVNKAWNWMSRNYLKSAQNNIDRSPSVAILLFKCAIDMEPDNAEAHRQLGLVYLKTGATEKARDHFGRACELGNRDACARINEMTGN